MGKKDLGYGFTNIDNKFILHYDRDVYSKFYKVIDLPTFEVIQSNGSSIHYFKDKNHVYLDSYMNSFCILEDVKPSDFEIIDFENGFASTTHCDYVFEVRLPYRFKKIKEIGGMYQNVDDDIYFAYHHKVEGADAATFEVLHGQVVGNVAKDKSHVYFRHEIVSEADAKSFSFLKECFSDAYYRECDHTFYALDQQWAFYIDTIAKNIKTIKTKNVEKFGFEVKDELGYAFDENYTYLFGKRKKRD